MFRRLRDGILLLAFRKDAKMKSLLRLLLILSFAFAGTAILAQDIQTRGSISGTVTDNNGGAISGATVKVTGPATDRTVTANDQGVFVIENLIPGTYKVRVENSSFQATQINNDTVYLGKTSTTNITLEPGQITETVNVTAGPGIDQGSAAVGSNLNDQLFQNIPVQRSVSSLFYLAPGATDSLGGGKDNPSISGGSALDN